MELLTQKEAALFLRLSERTLERLRATGDGPKFICCGGRRFYRKTDIEQWLDRHCVTNTAEARSLLGAPHQAVA